MQLRRATKTKLDTRTELKGEGKVGWFTSKTQTATSQPRESEPVETLKTYIGARELISTYNRREMIRRTFPDNPRMRGKATTSSIKISNTT